MPEQYKSFEEARAAVELELLHLPDKDVFPSYIFDTMGQVINLLPANADIDPIKPMLLKHLQEQKLELETKFKSAKNEEERMEIIKTMELGLVAFLEQVRKRS